MTVVHPGTTRTESMLAFAEERAAAAGLSRADVERKLAESVSIGRLVEPEEVASVVAFLASPLSVAITGDAVSVGGGAKGAIHY